MKAKLFKLIDPHREKPKRFLDTCVFLSFARFCSPFKIGILKAQPFPEELKLFVPPYIVNINYGFTERGQKVIYT